MGRLHELAARIDRVIQEKQLPLFRTKGLIALEAGFSLSLIDETTPDDSARINALKQAARRILGEPI
jgi:hypothetical protein